MELRSSIIELFHGLKLERVGLFLQDGIKYRNVRVQLTHSICDLASERLIDAASNRSFGCSFG